MPTVTIRRGPDAVQVSRAQLGLTNDPDTLIGPGDTVEVPADVAGTAPTWRALEDGEQRSPIKAYREGKQGTEVRELGTGLLAQEGNWEPVKPARTPSRVNETPEA